MDASRFSFLLLPFRWRRTLQILVSILYFLAIFAVYRAGYTRGLRDGAKLHVYGAQTTTTNQ